MDSKGQPVLQNGDRITDMRSLHGCNAIYGKRNPYVNHRPENQKYRQFYQQKHKRLHESP